MYDVSNYVCGLNVYDQEFTEEEIRQLYDFRDIIFTYGYTVDNLSCFIEENFKKVGYRLFLALKLDINNLGVMILCESDRRIINIIHKRCNEINNKNSGCSNIIITGDF